MVQAAEWQSTACILCSVNCGLEVKLDGRRLAKIKGDKENPRSKGYTCEKQARLDFYQNHADRLTRPLRRKSDGSFEEIDWDTAISEIAERFGQIRKEHGGEKIMYYGGGGQGNHLGGAYSGAVRRALGMRYQSNALAQEKTGEFWVERRMVGGRPEPDFEHAQVSVFVGKNPWQSHGFERARVVLKGIAKDPSRSLIVLDPRRTETAELADVFLQVRPGTDAFCLSAILAVLIEENWIDRKFIDERTTGSQPVIDLLSQVPIGDYCQRAGVSEADVREAARLIGEAESLAVLEDLGIEQSRHSTLNSFLQKLLWALTGNFGRQGTMCLPAHFGKLIGASRTDSPTPVGGHRIITSLIPCNVIADEILTDHPDRFRGMLIESGNPVHSLADSPRMREALAALECVVVIDVAMTETAECADYVLPAASQYEKWEATFFGGGFPEVVFQLRQPLMDPLPGTLGEPEIHTRLVHAMGALDEDELAPLREAALSGLEAFHAELTRSLEEKPHWAGLLPVVLYQTLGPALGEGKEAAALIWMLAQGMATSSPGAVRAAGFEGEGVALGNALFEAIFSSPKGVVVARDTFDASYDRIATEDGRVQLELTELLEELAGLEDESGVLEDDAYPFVLAAGERRTNTANTICRNPEWRKKDPAGSLRISPGDAARLGVDAGGCVRVSTKRGSLEAVVEITDTLRDGHVTLPNGLGLAYPDANGQRVVHGVAPNELTSSEDRDWLAGTPWHKYVRAQVEAIR